MSVCRCVRATVQCIVKKTAHRIRMPFGVINRMGSGMRQVVRFGDRSTGMGTFWGRIGGAPLYPMGILRRTCATVPQPSELRFGMVHAMGRGIVVLDGGQRRPMGKGVFGGFVLHFHNGKCHWVADGEMFPIRMLKLHNISVWRTYHWKDRFVGFLAIYSVSRSKLGFMRN